MSRVECMIVVSYSFLGFVTELVESRYAALFGVAEHEYRYGNGLQGTCCLVWSVCTSSP